MGVMRPIWFPSNWVNQRLPSGPAVMSQAPTAVAGRGKRVTMPTGLGGVVGVCVFAAGGVGAVDCCAVADCGLPFAKSTAATLPVATTATASTATRIFPATVLNSLEPPPCAAALLPTRPVLPVWLGSLLPGVPDVAGVPGCADGGEEMPVGALAGA